MASPFVKNTLGHTGFNPVRLSLRSDTIQMNQSKNVTKPKAPEKPLAPYMRFNRKIWESVKAEHPDAKLWEIGKIIGALWRDLPDSQKQAYIEEYEAEKIQYTEGMKNYHSSTAYQNWIAAKSKGMMDDVDLRETKIDSRISIMPADDENEPDDGGMSVKHLASARYRRNHMLMSELFDDSVVPDLRSVVTTQRMQVLKNHVTALSSKLEKLNAEQADMIEKHTVKRKKWEEEANEFKEQYKKVCESKPQIHKEDFVNMVERCKKELAENENAAPTTEAAPQPVAPASVSAPIPTSKPTSYAQNQLMHQQPPVVGGTQHWRPENPPPNVVMSPQQHMTPQGVQQQPRPDQQSQQNWGYPPNSWGQLPGYPPGSNPQYVPPQQPGPPPPPQT